MPFVLIIRELANSWAGRRPVQSTHPTRQEAEAELLDYVRRNWETEMGIDLLDDPEEIVRQYFEEVPEAYEIIESR